MRCLAILALQFALQYSFIILSTVFIIISLYNLHCNIALLFYLLFSLLFRFTICITDFYYNLYYVLYYDLYYDCIYDSLYRLAIDPLCSAYNPF